MTASDTQGNWFKRLGLTGQIVLAMALGVLLGSAMHYLIGYEMDMAGQTTPPAMGFGAVLHVWLVDGLFHIGGQIFVRGLKLLVVPLVFCSLVCGVALLGANMGRVGGRTIGLYLVTTALAITIALLVALLVDPGAGVQLGTDISFQAKSPPPFGEVLLNIFPTNPVQAMAEGNMLQIIIFALLFGAIMNALGRKVSQVQELMQELNTVFVDMVLFIVRFAPYGVFCLIGYVFSTKGIDVFFVLAKYFFVVLLVLVLHATLVYGSILRFVAGISPLQFLGKVRELMLVAFSTSSSNATLPVTLRTMTRNLGIKPSISSFTAPLGATINMDGTAIMQGTATVFIATVYGIDMTWMSYTLVILTATLASIGTAGVPGAGLIMLALVLEQAGIPVEGIGLILGVDRLLDMARTALNVTGDCVVTTVVARSEGEMDMDTFNNPDAQSAIDSGTGPQETTAEAKAQ